MTNTVFVKNFPRAFGLEYCVCFEIKKDGGPWGTSAQNPNFNVCMFANIEV